MTTEPRIFMIAGEPSADQHAAMLGEALLQERPVQLCGIGQARMRDAGFDLLFDSSGWSGIGVVDSLERLPHLLGRMRALTRHLLAEPPGLLVPIDFGAFNVRLLRRIRDRLACPVLYYFPPRSWSREANYIGLARLVDHVATPFSWSEHRLREAGVEATWVGHPVLDRIRPLDAQELAALRAKLGAGQNRTLIGLLPGSRAMEIRCSGREMRAAARIIADQRDDVDFLLSVAPSVPEEALREQVTRHGLEGRVSLIRGLSEIVQAADMAIVTSGTATLEAAAAGCPMLIIYRGTRLMAVEKWLRRFAQPFIGMPNILANREVVPELIHLEAGAQALAERTLALLADNEAMRTMQRELIELRNELGAPGVSQRVARLCLDMLPA